MSVVIRMSCLADWDVAVVEAQRLLQSATMFYHSSIFGHAEDPCELGIDDNLVSAQGLDRRHIRAVDDRTPMQYIGQTLLVVQRLFLSVVASSARVRR